MPDAVARPARPAAMPPSPWSCTGSWRWAPCPRRRAGHDACPFWPASVFQRYQLHKSIGITVLPAGIVRLPWRITCPPSALAFATLTMQTGTPFTGHFSQFVGQIALDPDHLETGHIVTMDSASTGNTRSDIVRPGKDRCDIAQFPDAVSRPRPSMPPAATCSRSTGR